MQNNPQDKNQQKKGQGFERENVGEKSGQQRGGSQRSYQGGSQGGMGGSREGNLQGGKPRRDLEEEE